MRPRRDLHKILLGILGSMNVYFQPPENLKINYPGIVYTRSSSKPSYADNIKYHLEKGYQIIYVSKDPDSDIPDKIEQLPKCSFDRHFVSDNLNHWIFTLYF